MGWLSSKGRGSFGVNLGRPIVTNGDFVAYSCAKVRAAIDLSFGVVSGVTQAFMY